MPFLSPWPRPEWAIGPCAMAPPRWSGFQIFRNLAGRISFLPIIGIVPGVSAIFIFATGNSSLRTEKYGDLSGVAKVSVRSIPPPVPENPLIAFDTRPRILNSIADHWGDPGGSAFDRPRLSISSAHFRTG